MIRAENFTENFAGAFTKRPFSAKMELLRMSRLPERGSL